MTEREWLIELFKGAEEKAGEYVRENDHMDYIPSLEEILGVYADHLLANGVSASPCKAGGRYYTIQRYCNTDPWETEKEPVMAWDCEKYCGRSDCSFSEYRIEEHQFKTVNFILRAEQDFGKTVFLTKEEAEKALKERSEGK